MDPMPRTTVRNASVQQRFAETLADVLNIDHAGADDHFFDDLGADSMVMARFCARVRKRDDLPTVSMKDIYRYPTIQALTTAFAGSATTVEAVPITPRPGRSPVAPCTEAVKPIGQAGYVLCGTLQVLLFLGYAFFVAVLVDLGDRWVAQGSDALEGYLRTVGVGVVAFLGIAILPIVAKWVLIGRWKPQRIRIWSLAYVRFWAVKTLVRINPMVLFAGSPLYVLYLRALGAKIGRGAVVFTLHAPVCTDLLTIGAGAVVRRDTFLLGYHAHAGVIETGPVSLGDDSFVGERAVLDIGTSLGDRAQLGHSSSLHAGQAVPTGQHWHGSPAQPADVDYQKIEPIHGGALRKAVYPTLQLVAMLLVTLPLVISWVALLLAAVPRLQTLLEPGLPNTWSFYRSALVVSAALFFGATMVGILVVATVPRVLRKAIKPDTVYPMYAFATGYTAQSCA